MILAHARVNLPKGLASIKLKGSRRTIPNRKLIKMNRINMGKQSIDFTKEEIKTLLYFGYLTEVEVYVEKKYIALYSTPNSPLIKAYRFPVTEAEAKERFGANLRKLLPLEEEDLMVDKTPFDDEL